jgi:hypothetical protein
MLSYPRSKLGGEDRNDGPGTLGVLSAGAELSGDVCSVAVMGYMLHGVVGRDKPGKWSNSRGDSTVRQVAWSR